MFEPVEVTLKKLFAFHDAKANRIIFLPKVPTFLMLRKQLAAEEHNVIRKKHQFTERQVVYSSRNRRYKKGIHLLFNR